MNNSNLFDKTIDYMKHDLSKGYGRYRFNVFLQIRTHRQLNEAALARNCAYFNDAICSL